MTTRGFDHLDDTLEKIKEAHKPALRAAAMVVKRIAQIYPPRPRGRKQGFVSDKQRRGFFALLRAGKITVPYVRTLLQRKSWNFRVRGFVATIRNKLHYAPFSQGTRSQTRFHRRTGWNTEGAIASQAATDVLTAFEKAYRKAIQG